MTQRVGALLGNLTIGAGDSVRVNGAGTTWEGYTPPAGFSSYNSDTGLTASTNLSTSNSDAIVSIDFGGQTYGTYSFISYVALNQSTTNFVTSVY